MNLILFGPPGSGKTTVGRICAQKLNREFVDSDEIIVARTGYTIPQIFTEQGEAAFRQYETEVISELAAQDNLVIAVGGGALADSGNRRALERSGIIVCLRAGAETILRRLDGNDDRPLLQGDANAKIGALLARRGTLYDSFPVQLETDDLSPAAIAAQIEATVLPTQFQVSTGDEAYPVVLGEGARAYLPALLREHDLPTAHVIASDSNVDPLWAAELGEHLGIPVATIPAGEAHKTLDTVRDLYGAFLRHGLDRRSVVLAVGGGVVGDVAGFAAATYMRGVRWINLPTTLLAMVDASIGGKVGVDLPEGKNLVGAFHPPAMIVADPAMLETLPESEYTAGLAEVVKHGVIADPELFAALPYALPLAQDLIRRAMAVKIDIVQRDPYERGERAKLNLGHTIGHGVEAASDYRLRHGEAIAVGMVAEARLAASLSLAEKGLADTIADALLAVGLPVSFRNLDPDRIRTLMSSDKKKRGGQLTFALPTAIGAVEYGVTAPDNLILDAIQSVGA